MKTDWWLKMAWWNLGGGGMVCVLIVAITQFYNYIKTIELYTKKNEA